MDPQASIIDFITRNRVSTTEVADALGKEGVFQGVRPVNDGLHRVGKVRCIFTANNSNYDVHDQMRFVQEGDVPIIFTHEVDSDRAVIGDFIAKYALLYLGAAAIVVQGSVRDVSALRREQFGVWSKDVSPLGCFNTEVEHFPSELEAKIRGKYDGGVAVCDDGGVTVIDSARVSADTLERIQRIELQEDVWFFCLDTLKWDTKRIVCDKDYLSESEVLSPIHREHLARLREPLDN